MFLIFLTALQAPRGLSEGLDLVGPERPRPEYNLQVHLFYGQSQDSWSTLHDVKEAQGNIDQINSILEAKYGTYEEAMSSLGMRVDGLSGFESAPLLHSIYVESSAEADAFGLVRNPVVPELHANAVLVGIAGVGFTGTIPVSEIRTEFGLLGGLGYEKRIDAFSTDIIEKIPIRSGHLSLYGLKQEADATELAGAWTLKPRLMTREVEYVTAVTPSSLDTVQGQSLFVFRWNAELEALHPLESLGGANVGLITTLGPQPLPIHFLPVTWDYSHRLQSFPEMGAMLGEGLRFDESWGHSLSWSNVAGFFGGYWGGQSSVRLGAFQASAGTWGIEGSSAYRTLGQRIWTANLGFGF